MGELGRLVPGAGGGMNYLPPQSFTAPMRGVMSNPGGMYNMFPGAESWAGPMGAMGLGLAGQALGAASGISPAEMNAGAYGPLQSIYGAKYYQEQRAAMEATNGMRESIAMSIKRSIYVGTHGREPGADVQRQMAREVQSLVRTGGMVAQMAPLFGVDNNAFMNAAYPERTIFGGMQTMAGAAPLPTGGAAAGAVTKALMSSGLPFGRGGRAELFADLSSRGMLPGRQSDLMAGEGTAQFQAAITKIKATLDQYEQALNQLKDVFGPNKGPQKLLAALDQMLAGSLSQMGPTQIARVGSQLTQAMLTTKLPVDYLVNAGAQGAQAYRSMGLQGWIGQSDTIAAMVEGSYRQEGYAGQTFAGNRTMGEFSGIAGRRLAAARQSEFSTVHGGVLNALSLGAASRGISTDGKQGWQVAQAMGAPAEMVRRLRGLQTGEDTSFATLQYFGTNNSARLAGDLEKLTGMAPSTLREMLRSPTAYGQSASAAGVSGTTLLRLQDAEVIKKHLGPQIRGTLRSLGGSGGAATIDSIAALVASGGFSEGDREGTLARLKGISGIGSAGRAATVYAAIQALDHREGLSSLGGVAAFTGGLSAKARAGMALSNKLAADAMAGIRSKMGAGGVEGAIDAAGAKPGTSLSDAARGVMGAPGAGAFNNIDSLNVGTATINVANKREGGTSVTRVLKETTTVNADTGAGGGLEASREHGDTVIARGY